MPFGQHIVSIAMMNDAFLQQSNRSDVCICHSYLDVSKVADNSCWASHTYAQHVSSAH